MNQAKILVVEDENIIAADLQGVLKGFGYSVSAVAASGDEAVRKAVDTNPDLVLMDIVLKGEKDGIWAAERIRARLDAPVIFLTAYDDEETLSRAKLTEPNGYILKPLNRKELHSTIEMALYKHKMERKLKENQQWLEAIVRSIEDAVIVTDTKGCIELMNPAAERLSGYKAEEAKGILLADIYNVRAYQHGPGRSAMAEAGRPRGQESGPVDQGPSTLVARDGVEIPVEDEVSSLRDSRGRFMGFVVTFRDVREHLRLEAESRRTDKLEGIRSFVMGTAHNFNNILAIILSHTSFLEHGKASAEKFAEAVAIIRKAVDRGAGLAKKLLFFSGETGARFEHLDTRNALVDFEDSLKKSLPDSVTLSMEVDPELPAVKGDQEHLIQALTNLTLNAREAMPMGGTLSIKATVVGGGDLEKLFPDALADRYTMISVRDTGIGMDNEVRKRLFEPFFSTKDDSKGAGLGLAVVRGIVEAHKGFLEVSSAPGEGTTVSIYLPASTFA